MLMRIEAYLRDTGQEVNMDPGVISRAIFEGLVIVYRKAIEGLRKVTGKDFDAIHIIGGGSQNNLINQFTANATGCRVVAGPVEASSLGNILAQLKADGEIESIAAGRKIIRESFELGEFESRDTDAWGEAEKRFDDVLNVS